MIGYLDVFLIKVSFKFLHEPNPSTCYPSYIIFIKLTISHFLNDKRRTIIRLIKKNNPALIFCLCVSKPN